MKRHVLESFRRRFRFKQRDRDIVIANRDSVLELKLLS